MARKKYKGKHVGGTGTKAKREKLPLIVRILIWLAIIALVGFIILWLVVNHYTSKMNKTIDKDTVGMTAEELWAQQTDTEYVEETQNGETDTGESTTAVPEEPDEETLQKIADADAALARLETGSGEDGADASGETAPKVQVNAENDIVNYLIIGSDRRDARYGNSDVMIVVSINRTTKKIHLTSLMRAMYVRIPASSGAYNGMLNWAYSMQGAPLCQETIELNFGLDIDHYVTFDFNSFKSVIDALGGVDVEITQSEAAKINSNTNSALHGGMCHLNGEQALAFARERHLDNDFKRTGRQRRILTACIQSLKGCSLSELNDVANVLLPYLSTDMNNMDIIAELPNALGYLSYEIDQLMLPVENMDGKHYYGNTHIGGHEMYIVDWDNNLKTLEEFINS